MINFSFDKPKEHYTEKVLHSPNGPVRIIQLNRKLLDEQVEMFRGKFLSSDTYDILLESDADVYKPNGELLLKFRKKILSVENCQIAYQVYRKAAPPSLNRGAAAGGKRFIPRKKKDGTYSNTTEADPANSGIVGYFDRYSRTPYCRMSAFIVHNESKWAATMPFLKEVSDNFRLLVPDRWNAQKAKCDQTHPDFIIKDTVFSTVTVNLNFRTATHRDVGDLKEGFGLLTALQSGRYGGCYLVFPAFRVAVDMRTRDLLACDVHEWHGNTELVGVDGMFERVSCVFYFRRAMTECGSLQQELETAKGRKPGDRLKGRADDDDSEVGEADGFQVVEF